MTTSQIIACTIAWTAALVAILALVKVRRARPVIPYTPVTPASEGTVCEAYRLPTTSEDSGLCARCGMSDYKHWEPRHA